ncbi:MAG: hypothetical protein RL726_2285, partial [Actinomycetota bacterium]
FDHRCRCRGGDQSRPSTDGFAARGSPESTRPRRFGRHQRHRCVGRTDRRALHRGEVVRETGTGRRAVHVDSAQSVVEFVDVASGLERRIIVEHPAFVDQCRSFLDDVCCSIVVDICGSCLDDRRSFLDIDHCRPYLDDRATLLDDRGSFLDDRAAFLDEHDDSVMHEPSRR